MNIYDQILLFIISFLANLFSAFAGGGAGLIQLPALLFLGLPFSIALGTHKFASVALGIGATLRHSREKMLDLKFATFILTTGVPGVLIGANIILGIPDRWAEIALGCLTISLGIYSWHKPSLGQQTQSMNRTSSGYMIGGIVLFLIGLLNGSLTSGTGLFVTLWLVRWFGLEYKRAVAYTLILVGMFWNGAGALMLGLLSEIRWDWLPALLLGSLLGGYAGAHLSIAKGNYWIKKVYEVLTILIGLKLILG
ncbi:MAG: sulfite exporter TauE/SafE family protein [Gammaproteobacteria bacterium]